MFIAIDLMLGGDLRYHLGRVPFSEEQIRGYVAEMAVATRALNEKHIIHRYVFVALARVGRVRTLCDTFIHQGPQAGQRLVGSGWPRTSHGL